MEKRLRDLLLQDLCARLPYGVKCQWGTYYKGILIDVCKCKTKDDFVYWDCYFEECGDDVPIEIVKPYLRPMSSMTEEEEKEYAEVVVKSQNCSYENNESATTMVNDWYLSKGFDVRGLIPKGLALEAPEGMYDIKNK